MTPGALLARLLGRKKEPPPLAARLDNPYRPVYGKERRFEELTKNKPKP